MPVSCVYTNAFDAGALLVHVADAKGLDECLLVGFHGLELVGCLGSAALAVRLDESGQSDVAERLGNSGSHQMPRNVRDSEHDVGSR